MKRKPVQLLNTGVDHSCIGLVLQPVAQGTFHWQREEEIQIKQILEAKNSHRLLKR